MGGGAIKSPILILEPVKRLFIIFYKTLGLFELSLGNEVFQIGYTKLTI